MLFIFYFIQFFCEREKMKSFLFIFIVISLEPRDSLKHFDIFLCRFRNSKMLCIKKKKKIHSLKLPLHSIRDFFFFFVTFFPWPDFELINILELS